MKIILDTNIWISFLIGHRLPEIRTIVTDERFDEKKKTNILKKVVFLQKK